MDWNRSLHNWPAALKKLIFIFVLISFIGVVIGGIFIEITTHMTPQGVVEQYKGLSDNRIEQADELKFPKPVKEMLTTTHNHILGLSSLFLIVGFLYLMCGPHSGLRIAIAVEPLISLFLTFGGLWVVRYLWEPFVYIVILSGTLMIATYAWMSVVIMRACITNTTPETEEV